MPSTRRSQTQGFKERTLANRYKVLRKLGSGNFGTVFVVEDLKSDEKWKVLKEIPVGELQPDETVSAVREARLLSKLDHPGIVKFHDSFIDGEHFCIVTELCEDGDLDMKINERRKAEKIFDEPRVVTWFIQLLLAVQYIHDRKILHRDLKTRNIFLHNNMIKVGDFGISRILMGTTDIATTFTGTPYYMSPEVLKHEGYNAKSDMWSLGVILYELCCLKRAFDGTNLMNVMMKIVHNDPPQLSSYFSSELSQIYHSMLNKDPAKRPSASELLKKRFIVSHFEKLKSKLNGKTRHENDAAKDSKAIAAFLSASAKKGAITGIRERRDSKGKKEELRPMTPGERLKQRKREKADEEARRLSQLTSESYFESRRKYSEVKNRHSKVSASLPWCEDEQQQPLSETSHDYSISDVSSYSVFSSSSTYEADDDIDDAHDFKSVSDMPDDDTGESGIPCDEELANTYYSQADDFEEDSFSSDSESESEDEYDDLVELMNNALDLTETQGDLEIESVTSCNYSIPTTLRNQKIESLRRFVEYT